MFCQESPHWTPVLIHYFFFLTDEICHRWKVLKDYFRLNALTSLIVHGLK